MCSHVSQDTRFALYASLLIAPDVAVADIDVTVGDALRVSLTCVP